MLFVHKPLNSLNLTKLLMDEKIIGHDGARMTHFKLETKTLLNMEGSVL